MAAGNNQILRQMGGNWLECLDEQGIFYFNQVTQQSSDSLPAELGGQPVPSMAQPMPQQMPQAMSQQMLQQMQQAPMVQQHPSYTPPPQVNSYTPPPQQMYSGHATPPPGAGQIYQQASYQPQPQPQFMQSNQQPQPYSAPAQQFNAYQQPSQVQQQQQMQQQHLAAQHQQMMQMQMAQAQPAAPQQQPAVQKMQFGDWAVYEDDLGRFFMHVPSGQQFEVPPPELMQAYQNYRAEQDQHHFNQLRQIEMQKAQIDQRLQLQTQEMQQRMAPAVFGA